MVHLKNLMLSRPYLSRIPDQMMLPDAPIPPCVQSLEADRYNPIRAAHARATRCADGHYGMVYFPQAEQSIRVDISLLSGRVKAWWYDPRNGKAHAAGEYQHKSEIFTAPIGGPDWVLVLDDAAQHFDKPGIV
jgi:hypothetical protein